MSLNRYVALPVAALVFAVALASCGSSTTNGGTSATATTAPTSVPPAATATNSASTAVIATATATVNGKSETILTDAQGLTLYYFAPDTATTSACTAGCAGAWPALVFSGSGAPTASSSLPGKLTVATTAPGRQQVEYNGHPLYTFYGDSGPDQTNGEGVQGKWFVATTSLAAM